MLKWCSIVTFGLRAFGDSFPRDLPHRARRERGHPSLERRGAISRPASLPTPSCDSAGHFQVSAEADPLFGGRHLRRAHFVRFLTARGITDISCSPSRRRGHQIWPTGARAAPAINGIAGRLVHGAGTSFSLFLT